MAIVGILNMIRASTLLRQVNWMRENIDGLYIGILRIYIRGLMELMDNNCQYVIRI